MYGGFERYFILKLKPRTFWCLNNIFKFALLKDKFEEVTLVDLRAETQIVHCTVQCPMHIVHCTVQCPMHIVHHRFSKKVRAQAIQTWTIRTQRVYEHCTTKQTNTGLYRARCKHACMPTSAGKMRMFFFVSLYFPTILWLNYTNILHFSMLLFNPYLNISQNRLLKCSWAVLRIRNYFIWTRNEHIVNFDPDPDKFITILRRKKTQEKPLKTFINFSNLLKWNKL